jgi:glutamine amidotransferase
MSTIGLIDYGMGNLHSVQRAFERLGCRIQAVHSGAEMEGCTALVLPGVGAFDPAMQRLEESGLAEALRHWCDAGGALLGICLGLQLLFEGSDEGTRQGLGLIPGHVTALPKQAGHPVPHMGWEPLQARSPSPLLPPDGQPAWMYFVHSYAAVPSDPACTTAAVTFGDHSITAAVWQGRIGACQFHPEKSSLSGEAMLRRWLAWVNQLG